MRPSRRQSDELRAISLERGVVKYAEGSCFVKFGDTQVLVTATLEDRLPPWLKGQARGWITAEYGMLPRATLERTRREASAGKQNGRTVEIQRLIGRSLRTDRRSPGPGRAADHGRLRRHPGRRRHPHRGDHRRLGGAARLRRLDEDARHAEGRAAARPGGGHLMRHLPGHAGARSRLCGGFGGRDRRQFVLTGAGRIVEVQGTAEKMPFTEEQFLGLLGLAKKGIAKLVDLQKIAVM